MNLVHGTPIMLTDTDGNAVWEATFAPFGETVSVNEDPDGDGTAVTMNIRLPGQYFDAETGLNYNWHRFYDPAVGRYVQAEEPIFDYSELQPFKYANNNPLAESDIRGSIADSDGCLIIYTGPESGFGLEWWTTAKTVADGLPGDAGCHEKCDTIRVSLCDSYVMTRYDKKIKKTVTAMAESGIGALGNCTLRLNERFFAHHPEYPPNYGHQMNGNDRVCILAHEFCHMEDHDVSECSAYQVLHTCEEQLNRGRADKYFDDLVAYACKKNEPETPACSVW